MASKSVVVMGAQVSWSSVWAKSWPFPPQEVERWLPLHQHLDDSQGVASLLLDHWVPSSVLARIADEVGGDEAARGLVCWLAAVHDVGKVSPAFAAQVDQLRDRVVAGGFVMRSLLDEKIRSRVNHSLVGHLAVYEWLLARGVRRREARQLASVVGSHHGVTPEQARLAEADEQVLYSGDESWRAAQRAVLDRAADRCSPDLSVSGLSTPSLVLMTALVIMADWIASNAEYFPLWELTEVDGPDDVRTAARLKEGWESLGMPPRWVAPVPGNAGETFEARFGFAAEEIRAVQVEAVKTARAMGGAGLMIVEAPMGVGKTEAALLAAEVLAHDSGANGCFVALPTQATTDAMFGRVRSWLDRIPGGATLTLAHGKAHLNDEYRGLARRGHIDESCGAVAHDWLRGRKKAGLAGFVVGTIDQVLLAGLKSRHVMLRHLALAGKVVIIDEVHAYDVYMSQYLHRVMEWLGAYRVPVILLSATLPDARRAELLAAYDSTAPRVQTPGYPAITATNIEPQTLPLPDRTVSVAVDRLGDDLDAVKSYLREHLADGGCAVVVRNTVRRVQETADHLADEFEVTINHARFLACDRAEIDRELLRRFGPPTTAQGRPRRHVVVASQVVEQSLDIDFDVMVTDLAPMDLLLQRMGRLHRHDRPDRAMRARCAVTGADWSTTPPTPVRGSTFVYDPHHLLRAAALLNGVEELSLPQDIARLVQDAYGDDRLGPESWQPVMGLARDQAAERARKRGASARTYLLPRPSNDSLVGWLSASADEVDEDHHRSVAQVRDGADSLEVLVVQHDTDGGLRTPDWVKGGGQQIPIIGGELPWPLVRVISACSLRLPHALCHEGVIDAVIRELEDGWRVSSFEETRALKGQLVLAFDDDRTAELQGYRLTYDPTRGLLHERI